MNNILDCNKNLLYYIFNRRMELELYNKKTDAGDYLWQAGSVVDDIPNTIMGKPYILDNTLDDGIVLEVYASDIKDNKIHDHTKKLSKFVLKRFNEKLGKPDIKEFDLYLRSLDEDEFCKEAAILLNKIIWQYAGNSEVIVKDMFEKTWRHLIDTAEGFEIPREFCEKWFNMKW